MEFFQIIAVLLTLSGLFSYLNCRFIKLPTTIGLMLISLVVSMIVIVFGESFPAVQSWAVHFLQAIDFNKTLLHGMLSFLLFAGALHVNINDLHRQYRIIGGMATFGILLSTFLVGTSCWYLLPLFGLQMDYIYCLIFGALISPTDPIAVLGILKTAGASKSLETKITGESLFNDGVGVVVFLVLLGIAMPGEGHGTGPASVLLLFVREAVGGVVFGLAAGYVTYILIKQVDEYQVEVLLTLALVTGGYALAEALHLSAPIAIVVAGLLIGNHGRSFAMSERTREHLDTFWELIDEVLNAVLFLLIGLEVLILNFTGVRLLAGVIVIPVILLARMVSVAVPVQVLKRYRSFSPHVVKILTWAGLRGGISVALALSLPAGPERETILVVTYAVVVFSIVVQGLSVGPLLSRLDSWPG
jgi:CPA1 family monovalent cation:H+ antiporter